MYEQPMGRLKFVLGWQIFSVDLLCVTYEWGKSLGAPKRKHLGSVQ